MQKAFQNVVTLEKMTQASVFNFFNKTIGPGPAPVPSPVSTPAPQQTPINLFPIDVSGFYKVTGPTQVTFYVTTDVPTIPVGAGWTGEGFLGIMGQIQITGATLTPGPGYKWSFTLQTDTDQNIEGTQQVVGATLYPPKQLQYSSKRIQVPLYGHYSVVQNAVTFTFTAPPPNQTSTGWLVSGLPTIKVPLIITYYGFNYAILAPIDGSLPQNTTAPVYVNGVPALIQEPLFTNTFVPGKFTDYVSPETTNGIPNVQVQLNPNVHVGNYPEQRQLNTDVEWQDPQPGTRLFPESKYIEEKDKGFSSGSILSLQAIGPQEKYLLTDDMTKSQWNPTFKRYSNFVMYQKVYPFPPPNPYYQGSVVQIELRPTELGHLLSNMYLSVTLPALPNGGSYTPNVGRALLQQVDLLVNETVVETLYDDWYVIRDQMFLDADEQYGLQTALNVSAASPVTYVGTGGNSTIISSSNVVHTFLNSNSFTLNYGTYVNLTVVGGGGAGAGGRYTSNITSNISGVLSVPSTFTVQMSNTVGAYVGANVYISVTNAPAFTTNVYVSSFTSSSVTFTTFGSGSIWSNIIPSSSNTITFFNGNGGGGGGVLNQSSVFLPAGTYSVTVGSGGTPTTINGGLSSFSGTGISYNASGGFGGALGGASGTAFTSNTSYQYFSNIVYQSGGGASSQANVTTNTLSNAFTNVYTLGSGGNGYALSNVINFSNSTSTGFFYVGGGGGGASNTSITGTLVTPGGLGGGGAGSSNVTGFSSQNTAAISGTTNSGGGGGGAFGTTPGSGGSGLVIVTYTTPQSIVPSSTITIPLEFFFCRRHSHNNKGRERLRKPYLPVCAMWAQRLYVRFTFRPNTWWCNAPVTNNTDVYPPGTTLWPNLITEEILLENPEKLYYQNTPLKYIVNRVQKESALSFNSTSTTLQLTANYPVQVLAWFFRNKSYENVTDGRYYASRYSYGYSTQYIQTGIQLQFPSGTSNFVDVINNAKITLNNVDILSTFQGSLYYSFKQPMEHYLSIPSKNIYMYSFGLTPKEYNQGGYLNFSKLNSQTTYIQLNFNPAYTNQLITGYNLYLFYYGYSLLQFQGGFASLPFL